MVLRLGLVYECYISLQIQTLSRYERGPPSHHRLLIAALHRIIPL